MAVTNFIPEVWSAQLLASLKKSLVFAGPAIANRNYEGEIANFGELLEVVRSGALAIQKGKEVLES
jgi:hypothetical protein